MSASAEAVFLHASRWIAPAEAGLDPGAGLEAAAARGGESWLLLDDAGGTLREVAEELIAAGARCAVVAPGGHGGEPRPGADELRRIVGELESGGGRLAGVVHAWGCGIGGGDGPSEELLDEAVEVGCMSVLELAMVLRERHDAGGPAPRFVLVTRGAQAAGALRGVVPEQGMLWGLGRVVAFEHPELRMTRVDLDVNDDRPAACTPMVGPGAADEELAFRDADVLVHRVRPLSLGETGPCEIRADGAYAITGGLGGVGLATARWLVARGAGHVVLTSRHPPDEATAEAVADLGSHGTSVEVVCADVGGRDGVSRMLETARARGALRGVFHAAGAIDDALVAQVDRSRFDRVLSPKAGGALLLHLLTLEDPLDHFVLYSSGAAILGHFGQASYAAANAYLDALAQHRAATGRAALSVNWGGWRDVGYAHRQGMIDRYERFGLVALRPDDGTELLDRLLASRTVNAAVVGGDWGKYADMVWFGTAPPLLRELVA